MDLTWKLISETSYKAGYRKMLKRKYKLPSGIEKDVLSLKKKKITSAQLTELVLMHLKRKHIPTFLRFLTNCKDISTEAQMKRELSRYL